MNQPVINLSQLSLYYTPTCPYCHRVLRAVKGLGIDLTLCDISDDIKAFKALRNGGGRTTVPCLRIDHADGTQWLYESMDIVAFLNTHFGE